jgi:crotonobetainyl-CoA:carnitine CoA-transferase CaiB-like acyl-CoA transferase
MTTDGGPLQGITVVERSATAAGAYAGRLLAVLGADVIMVEPTAGHALRRVPPLLPGTGISSLFAYLAAGKASVLCDVQGGQAERGMGALLATARVYIDDHDRQSRGAAGLSADAVMARFPHLVYTSVRPFGDHGPKAGWSGREINIFHASGEGNLLPNGLAAELCPDGPPLKVAGYFAELQGGLAAALGTLSALWSANGTHVDVSVQDAAIAVGAFAIQRYGDGARETRQGRSFAYGGVLECADGYIELLTLEDRQWSALTELVGRPDWAADEGLGDSVARSQRGPEINRYLRDWARGRRAGEIVDRAQRLGVPVARYSSPAEVTRGAHETARQLFELADVPGAGLLPVLRSPFHLDGKPLRLARGVPRPGQDQWRLPVPAVDRAAVEGTAS